MILSAILDYVFGIVSSPTYVLLMLLVFIITYGLFTLRKQSGFPPGPMGYPFIGNILDILEPQITFTRHCKKYGDIFTIKIGSQHVVVLNTIDLIKEALVKKQNDFAGRPYAYSLSGLLAEESEDIIFGNFNAKWRFLRKIGHQAIRNYASGENLEYLVRCEAFPRFQKAIAAKNGKPFHPEHLVFLFVGNIIATMCFGESYDLEDPELVTIIHILNDWGKALGNGLLCDFLPIFKYIPTKALRDVKRLLLEFQRFVQSKIEEHRRNFGEDNYAGDKSLVGNILRIVNEAKMAGEDQADKLNDVNCRQTVADMFGAGHLTSVSIIEWLIAHMITYPDVQAKVQREIDDVIGQDRLPLLSDKGKLPYCEAVIHEVMRIRAPVPLAIPHTTTVDTSVGGYNLPKDTWIMCNIWNIQMDEKYWDNPEEFRPERFLDEDGNVLPKPESYLPFSAGRRICLGNELAKNELFLTFTSLFQQFTFKVPPGQEKPCMKPHCEALAIRCCKFEVVAIPRIT